MHILITDSGVGGLSVCAYAERHVRVKGFTEPVRLTFANAAPANDFGYNSMATREEKIATFDRFLRNVTQRYSPDSIYVACNTLSVLLQDTPCVSGASIPVKGIVETGVALLLRELREDPRSVAVVFGTQTTIDAGTYPRLLEQHGIGASRIVSQACPGLADTISEDREGSKSAAEIGEWVSKALAQLPEGGAPVVACLACTHYGYRREFFEAALQRSATVRAVINPNESAAGDLFQAHGGDEHRVEVDFVTRYAIPPRALEALSFYLDDISPRTVAAMRRFELVPDLF